MAKINWSPWMVAVTVSEKTDMPSQSLLSNDRCAPRQREGAYVWEPAADLYEGPEAFLIQVELPGLALEQVSVEIDERFLSVTGERRFEKDVEGGVWQVLERSYGPFCRTFPLPAGIDPAGTRAVLKDGLLTITLPKISAGCCRRICVTCD